MKSFAIYRTTELTQKLAELLAVMTNSPKATITRKGTRYMLIAIVNAKSRVDAMREALAHNMNDQNKWETQNQDTALHISNTSVKSEDTPQYAPRQISNAYSDEENQIIDRALEILADHSRRPDFVIESPERVKQYVALRLGRNEREVFGVMFLDNRHGVIDTKDLFFGTINSAAVHPREVVKQALYTNAAAVILYHNHPSGCPDPSQDDIRGTKRIKNALNLIDVRLLDHIVAGGTNTISMAERGLI